MIADGDAEKLDEPAEGQASTVTVVCSVTGEQPEAPDAVSVYVVEEVGETETEPEGPKAPTPAMLTPAAAGTLHESVVLWP